TFLYFVTPSMITYNVLVYSEAPLVFFFTFFLYSFFSYLEASRKKFLLLSGISAGFVALSKFTGLLVFPLMLVLFFSGADWKKNLKGFAVLFAIALVVGSSSNIRQILSYEGICQPRIPADNRCYTGEAPAGVELDIGSFSGYVQQSGTNLSLIDIGVMNYIQFGYTSAIFLLFVAGVVFGMLSRNGIRSMSIAGIFLYGLLAYGTINARTEDSIRAVLIGVVPLFVLGGIYFAGLLETVLAPKQSRIGNHVSVILAVLLILLMAFYGYAISANRVAEMKSVKQFSPEYLEGCRWMNENVPKGSYTINLWGAPCQFYAPGINSVWTDMKELPGVLFSKNDEKVIPLLERNGIGYIVVAKFSISNSNVITSTPAEFVSYLAGSQKYSLVYENPATLIFKVNYG
ncbi:MAG: glycosyltransferase family 39 protein, partial [Candidatus Aenigmarchaeota archaeon]|nr:glycosyltransferase family 39 protein [Candidatus Aenigmarchaeota archaeon]